MFVWNIKWVWYFIIIIAVYLGVNLGLPDSTSLTNLFQQSVNRQAINSSSKTVLTCTETRGIQNQEYYQYHKHNWKEIKIDY